jgi:hypothetical protein
VRQRVRHTASACIEPDLSAKTRQSFDEPHKARLVEQRVDRYVHPAIDQRVDGTSPEHSVRDPAIRSRCVPSVSRFIHQDTPPNPTYAATQARQGLASPFALLSRQDCHRSVERAAAFSV